MLMESQILSGSRTVVASVIYENRLCCCKPNAKGTITGIIDNALLFMLDCFIPDCHRPTPANNIEENGGITTYTPMLLRNVIVVG